MLEMYASSTNASTQTLAARRQTHVQMSSLIQTIHSFLMRRFSSSTSQVLVRAEDGHFEQCKDDVIEILFRHTAAQYVLINLLTYL